MTITLDDLKANAKFRGTLFLDMDRGAYENHYQSETYPRLSVVKGGGPRVGRGQKHYTSYFVDSMECPDLDAVITMLNTTPHPKRTDLGRHQSETGT